MAWLINVQDAKMLLDIPFPMNNVIIDHLALNLVDICLDNKLQILCENSEDYKFLECHSLLINLCSDNNI